MQVHPVIARGIKPAQRWCWLAPRNRLARTIAVLGCLQFTCANGLAQEVRAAYLPLTFPADSGPVRTSACLQVEEHQYPTTRWWEDPRQGGAGAASFRAVLEAMKSGNRAALQKLSDPAQVKNAADFQQQADAYIKQMGIYDVTSVTRAYAFDGLMVFFAAIQGKSGRAGFAPFVFAVDGDSLLFRPNRSGLTASYAFVNDWFNASWGPSRSTTPVYCDASDVKRATHRASIGGGAKPSTLFLTGSPVDVAPSSTDAAPRVRAKDAAMRAAAEKGVEALAPHMTAEGAARLKRWSASASETEKKAYIASIAQQRPFFVFDLSTVLVVYTRTGDGSVQVLYFTSGTDKSLVWTNATRATSADAVFKRGPLFEAAQSEKPFSALAVSAR